MALQLKPVEVQAAEILELAATLPWCQGETALTKDGYLTKVNYDDCHSFCVVGALRRAQHVLKHGDWIAFDLARKQLQLQLPLIVGLMQWNDAADRTVEEVRALELAAAAKLRAQARFRAAAGVSDDLGESPDY